MYGERRAPGAHLRDQRSARRQHERTQQISAADLPTSTFSVGVAGSAADVVEHCGENQNVRAKFEIDF